MGLVSQLVMRSFDVSDKGEVNKREGPLGRRGERTPDHHHQQQQQRSGKGNKWYKSVGGGRKQLHPTQTGQKVFFLLLTKPSPLSDCIPVKLSDNDGRVTAQKFW